MPGTWSQSRPAGQRAGARTRSARVDRRGVGLDPDGFIEREGALDRVPRDFEPVVSAAEAMIRDTFGPGRLHSAHHGAYHGAYHSAYLYGSVPRGTAVPGVSDLDVLIVLRAEPTPADRSAATTLAQALGARFPQIIGAQVSLVSTAQALSDLERYDLGWFVACMCTPLIGEDLAARLPRYRPTSLLARETNGDIGDLLPGWRDRLKRASTAADLRTLSRGVGRRLVRTGFTLVMPRWGGWTSDLGESASVFGRYYPERREQMRTAAVVARTPTTDAAVLSMLIDDLGSWLAAEYVAVHGRKAPRGGNAT
jgi:uncharacterized protein